MVLSQVFLSPFCIFHVLKIDIVLKKDLMFLKKCFFFVFFFRVIPSPFISQNTGFQNSKNENGPLFVPDAFRGHGATRL